MSSRLRAFSNSITWISACMQAASVLGLIGTHSAEQPPVTDRCGSNCTRLTPCSTRAAAWRQTPHTPPEASMLLPKDRMYLLRGVSGQTMKARCHNSP